MLGAALNYLAAQDPALVMLGALGLLALTQVAFFAVVRSER